MRLQGEAVHLRPLRLEDVSEAYIGWMNDAETNQYMETRWAAHTRETVAAFVADKLASTTEHLFGIFVTAGDRHIGNLKVGPVNPRHANGDISYFIGDRQARGRGYAGAAVGLGVRFGFEHLGLEKLLAGVYAANLASAGVLERNGFVREAVRPEHVVFGDGRMDVFEYGLLRREWRAGAGLS